MENMLVQHYQSHGFEAQEKEWPVCNYVVLLKLVAASKKRFMTSGIFKKVTWRTFKIPSNRRIHAINPFWDLDNIYRIKFRTTLEENSDIRLRKIRVSINGVRKS